MIPNNIILTYKNDNVPSYVFNNIKRLNSDKDILFLQIMMLFHSYQKNMIHRM